MQNDTISYTQHTGETNGRGAGDGVGPARAVAPVGLGEAVHEACCSVGTREVARVRESRVGSVQVSGRSMIEMLGVLAIIGALSVGGLAALRVAQSKLRANVIANDVMLAAADLLPAAENMSTSAVTTSFAFTPKTTLTAKKCFADEGIEIMVSNVPQGVCQQVMKIGNIKGIKGFGVAQTTSTFCDNSTLGDSENSCLAGDGNKLVFLVNNISHVVTCGGITCPEGTYCRYSNPTDASTVCNPSSGCNDCVGVLPSPLACTAIGKTYDLYVGGQNWLVSNSVMNYWSAISWCEANGLSLATSSAVLVGCPSSAYGAICQGENTAHDKTFVTDLEWEGDSVFYKLGKTSPLSLTTAAWLSDHYTTNSCYAYYAGFGSGRVIYDSRGNNRYALCQ